MGFVVKEGGGGGSHSVLCMGFIFGGKYMNPQKMAHYGISIFFR